MILFAFTRSSVDEAAKEKLAPFSALTADESYASRDLEKVCFDSQHSDLCHSFKIYFARVILVN